MKELKQSLFIDGKEVTIQTGKFASQAPGAVMLTMGGTTLLATVTVDKVDAELDYFPLGVEYIEKMYARGALSGSRFKKREGHPSDEAVIKAREVDHSIRSLFPKSFKKGVLVVLTVMAYDGVNDPQALTIIGASLALLQSGLPFHGPCSSVIICLDKEGNVIVNPSAEDREHYEAEFIISGVDGKALSIEGWGKEVSEESMDKILDKADEIITAVNKDQKDVISKITKSMDIDINAYDNTPAPHELVDLVKSQKLEAIKKALFNDKVDRNLDIDVIKKELKDELITNNSDPKFTELEVDLAVEYVSRSALREAVLKEDKRVSGRKLDEVRKLSSEIDILPTVHGSALFSRGETQSLSIVTLGSKSNELLIDDMEGESSKSFMHHYNFPNFSTGEAGKYRYLPGRREIGHGAIGENALRFMLPSQEEFPYTIRAVSEILSSNGSTSMAATCASSMALMAAGVPLKEQVAGIGVGLITNDDNEDDYKLLLDIEGIEDFYGDMDFKVCGTKNGITAIQYENKLMGVKIDVLKKAIRVAKLGRETVLANMNAVISKPKDELAPNAPKVETLTIETDQIGALIGPGGKNIKGLVEESKKYAQSAGDIAVEDDGVVTITAANKEQIDFIKNSILAQFKPVAIGDIFEGPIEKIATFGLFVTLGKDKSGLVHISEVSSEFIKDLNTKFKEGDVVKVKVIKIENGKIGLTMKGV